MVGRRLSLAKPFIPVKRGELEIMLRASDFLDEDMKGGKEPGGGFPYASNKLFFRFGAVPFIPMGGNRMLLK